MSIEGVNAKSDLETSSDGAENPTKEVVLDLNEARRLIGHLADDSPSDDEDLSEDSPRRQYLPSVSTDHGRDFQKSYVSLPAMATLEPPLDSPREGLPTDKNVVPNTSPRK